MLGSLTHDKDKNAEKIKANQPEQPTKKTDNLASAGRRQDVKTARRDIAIEPPWELRIMTLVEFTACMFLKL